MKKLRIGLLAVVAVLAMSFTIASRSEATALVQDKDDYTCLTSDKSVLNFTPSTTGVPQTLSRDLNACPGAEFYCAEINSSTSATAISCGGGTADFCCATIVPNASECEDVDFPDQVIIHCKP